MSSTKLPGRIQSTLRQFLDNGASGGIVLMVVAALAIITANSPMAESYFDLLHLYVGPLSLQHWINDALMAVFFLLVGLEIKREMLDGQLSSWSRRVMPGAAAAGGMVFPALTYVWLNWENPGAIRLGYPHGAGYCLRPWHPVAFWIACPGFVENFLGGVGYHR